MSLKRVDDLELGEDMSFQRREWFAQRAGWVVLWALMVVALLGLFGIGPIASTRIRDEGGSVELQYQRFGRRGADSVVTVYLSEEVTVGGDVALWVSEDYLKGMKIDQITPMPDTVESRDDGFVYTFLLDRPGAAATVVFDFTPDSVGPLQGGIGLDKEDALTFTHFFYP